MKKPIQIVALLLQFLAVISYIGIIKIAIAWKSGATDSSTFIAIVTFAIIVQAISSWLKNKYPEEVNNAEDVVYTRKELEERSKGNKKNPLFVKILLIIPITFAVLVVFWGIYTLIQVLTGNI